VVHHCPADDPVTVEFIRVADGQVMTVHRGDGARLRVRAGRMHIEIDGESTAAYCVDMYNTIGGGYTYEAELIPAPTETPWCEIGWMLSNFEVDSDFAGAVQQVAIWKALEPAMSVDNADVDAAAEALLADAAGTCPLTCQDDVSIDTASVDSPDGVVDVTFEVVRGDGEPVVGQWVALSTSAGTLLSDPVVLTDEAGRVSATVDPEGAEAVTIDATLDARTLYQVAPTASLQQLLAFLFEECAFEGAADWSVTALGDPHTIGFWKHEVGGPGRPHIDDAVIESWLPIEVLGTSIETFEQLEDILWIDRVPVEDRALQQCAATHLNVLYGEAGWLTQVDVGAGSATLASQYAAAEDAFWAGDAETAKTFCDDFNNL
jgi:hypothetical protein